MGSHWQIRTVCYIYNHRWHLMAAPTMAVSAQDKHTESDGCSEGTLMCDRQSMLLLHMPSWSKHCGYIKKTLLCYTHRERSAQHKHLGLHTSWCICKGGPKCSLHQRFANLISWGGIHGFGCEFCSESSCCAIMRQNPSYYPSSNKRQGSRVIIQ